MLTLERMENGKITLTSARALCLHLAMMAEADQWPDEAQRWWDRYHLLGAVNVTKGDHGDDAKHYFEGIGRACSHDNERWHVRFIPAPAAPQGE